MGTMARYKKVLSPPLISSYFHHRPSIWWSSIFLTSPHIEPIYQSFPSGLIFLLSCLELFLPRWKHIRSHLEHIGPHLEGSHDIHPIFPCPATVEISLGSLHSSPHF